ncbi:MAG: hypothetical protein OHK0023_16280 [Anaerolineae bacterium]
MLRLHIVIVYIFVALLMSIRPSLAQELTPNTIAWGKNNLIAIGYSDNADSTGRSGITKIFSRQQQEIRTLSPQAFRSLAWRPDVNQNHLAITGYIGIAYVVDASTGAVLQEIKPPNYANGIQVVWSPDGKYLGFLRSGSATVDGDVSVWDIDQRKMVYYEPTFTNTTLAWHPDSKLLAIGRYQNPSYPSSNDVSIVNIERGTVYDSLLMSTDNAPRSVLWDLTGSRIYVLGINGLEIWDGTSYQRLALHSELTGTQLDWLTEGQRLVISSRSHITIFHTDTEQVQFVIPKQAMFAIEAVTANPNSAELAYIRYSRSQSTQVVDKGKTAIILDLSNR